MDCILSKDVSPVLSKFDNYNPLIRNKSMCIHRPQRIYHYIHCSSRNKQRQRVSSSSKNSSVKLRGTGGHGVWRFMNLEVPAEIDPGKDYYSISEPLIAVIASVVGCHVADIPNSAFSIVRKSFDARKVVNNTTKGPKFVYTVDLQSDKLDFTSSTYKRFISRLHNRPGKLQFIQDEAGSVNVDSLSEYLKTAREEYTTKETVPDVNLNVYLYRSPKITVVGSGPAGLFAALVLAECGAKVTLLERGQPVEKRGSDIGSLMVRRKLHPDSNFCFGEGGAGTWSDGKLTTRIGRNSESVRMVLATLVKFGAPPHILIDGKPHVGTDRLVQILRQMRNYLHSLGVDIRFGVRMVDLLTEGDRVSGVTVTEASEKTHLCTEDLVTDAVVLAVGHSARDVYVNLLEHNIVLTPKPFAVGFRVEHPQELINEIQYKEWATKVQAGAGKIPVADYRVATNIRNTLNDTSAENNYKGCYSFCMCPGGQIVPTSTDPAELCINGMSFSRRSSKWANAAVVITVSPSDLEPFITEHGPLAGVAFQKQIEQEAAIMGGGNMVVPAQVLPDFLNSSLSGNPLPSSSYRLGVKEAPLHTLYSEKLTEMFKIAVLNFNKQIPGFIDRRALLHAAETRTSSPVRIDRDPKTFECISAKGLYPIGEGAGYAGGIVSAAVDGLNAGLRLAEQLGLCKDVVRELSIEENSIYY